MLWRDSSTHQISKGHEQEIAEGNRAKLLLANWRSGGDWGKPSMEIIGDEWSVDSYRHDPWDKPSCSVIVEATIRSTPPLVEPFTRRYSLHLAAKTIGKVSVTETAGANSGAGKTGYTLSSGSYSVRRRSRQRGSAHLQVGEHSTTAQIARVDPQRSTLSWDPREPFRGQFNADGSAVIFTRRNPHDDRRGELIDFEVVEEND